MFWCGGHVALNGGDPYLVEPLRSCEHATPVPLLARSPNLVMPFVLPAFDVAPLELLARLPMPAAGLVFAALSALALVASIALVARATGAPVVLCAAALGLSVGLPSLVLGQIVPFELLALAISAFACGTRRDALAGASGALSLLEPHVGVFVVAALAVAIPRARPALAWGLLFLGFIAATMGGLASPASYAATLGEHARAEAGFLEQYSLTYALTSAHVPTAAALVLGAASSMALLVLALIVARRAAASGPRAAIVFVPAAFSVVGGTFVHITQVALAVPAALLLLGDADRRVRALGAVGLVLLAVPWPYPVMLKGALASALVVIGIITWQLGGGSYRLTLSVVAVAWLVFSQIENHPPAAPPAPVLARAAANEPASEPWGRAVAQMSSSEPRFLLTKLPTWCGLLAIAAAAAYGARAAERSM